MYINTFPKELAELKNWVDWRYVPNPKGGKDKKPLFCPATGKHASVNAPSTWGTLDEALRAKEKYGYSGIGIVFTKEMGIVAIDVDDCLNGDEITELGKLILEKAPKTYIERSPSKQGYHMLVRGKLPGAGKNNQEIHVEIYDTLRYFTVTGDNWHDCVDTIAEDNGIVDFVYKLASKKMKPNETSPASVIEKVSSTVLIDDNLIKLAHASKDGTDFGKLYRGEWQGMFKSQSEGDFALCRKLAFWSGKNETQIDRIFRTSGLMREKWDENHHAGGITYGAKTITNACAATKSVYSPTRKTQKSQLPAEVAATIAEKSEDGQTGSFADIVGYNKCYYRNKGDKFYQITNFTIEPIEMLTYDEGAQITANFVTDKGEKFLIHLEAPSMADLRSFKVALGKVTFALTFLGGAGDLDYFKMFVNDMKWKQKRGAKTLGIYPRNNGEKLVYVDSKGAVGVGNVKDDSIVQVESSKVIQTKTITITRAL